MSKIRILAVSPDSYGIGKFRILDPFKFIGDNYADEFHIDISFNVPNDNKSFEGYDIVVYHSYIHQTTHEDNIARLKWLKVNGIKTVMDIDDYWLPDNRHPQYKQIMKNKMPEKKLEMLKLSDYITTTTPVFAKSIFDKIKHKNIQIFPNAINEDEEQFQANPTKSDKIRFGWSGGSSHLQDIELLRDGIDSTYSNFRDKIQFNLCGFDTRGEMSIIERDGSITKRPIKPEESVWFKYEKIFTKNYSEIDLEYKNILHTFVENIPYDDSNKPYRRFWTKDITKYGKGYNNFDISLIPLVDSSFNANKSQLKIIEAGFHKKAIIASNVSPYTIDLVSMFENGNFLDKGNALLVDPRKNHKDWGKHMKRLIENPNMIEDLGNRLYDTVKDTYSLKIVSENRKNFLKSIINK